MSDIISLGTVPYLSRVSVLFSFVMRLTNYYNGLCLLATTTLAQGKFITGKSSSPLFLPLAFAGSSAITSSSNTKSCSTVTKLSSTTTAEESTMTDVAGEKTREAYDELVKKLKVVTQLSRAQAVLDYDRMVFMSESDRTSAARGAQLSALAGIIHEKATDPSIQKLLETALTTDEEEARILELVKASYLKKQRISSELEAKRAALTSSAYNSWVKARQANDFAAFESSLQDCFDTACEIAAATSGATGTSDDTPPKELLYNEMLDEYEMGMDAKRINDIFDQIQESLVPLIAKVIASPSEEKPSTDPLKGVFDVEKQKEVNRQIVKQLGFDESHGRIDVSVHPFTISFSSADVRITSRFREDEWYQGLAGTIHEGGHAMYEQNLGSSDLEIDTALSMGVHESQSLFWERHVGLSKPFWEYATPILQEAFPENFKYTPQQVYGAVNAVSPSFIRVEADELTYPLHVILRYNIERNVVQGRLQVKDIPKQWNADMKNMLHVDVPSDDKGCLQDVHWSMLAIGYFPTYLLGSATAAQLSHYCHQDIPDMDDKISKGDFAEIKEWLVNKVHKHGKRYKSLDDLLEAQVGEKLNPKYFIDYLTEKYTELYKL